MAMANVRTRCASAPHHNPSKSTAKSTTTTRRGTDDDSQIFLCAHCLWVLERVPRVRKGNVDWTDGRSIGGWFGSVDRWETKRGRGSSTRMAQVSVQPSHHVSERQCKHQADNWRDKCKRRNGDETGWAARRIVLEAWKSCGLQGRRKRNQSIMMGIPWMLQLLAAALLGYGVGIVKMRGGQDMSMGFQVRIKNLQAEHGRDFGRPGLSHLTLWGASQDSMEQVEVWMQTFAPGAGTPIHRHDNEEIFLVNHGQASIRWQRAGEKTPMQSVVPKNGTFVVPSNVVHQIWNDGEEDVQVTVIIGKPPIRVYLYECWNMNYDQGKLKHPYTFDI